MKRILTIDGGGMKGVFPASFLATLEDAIGDTVANFFDLIVGTSTGGIIALGLGLGFSAQQILAFYEESGATIFSGNRFLRAIRRLGVSKYSEKPLKAVLESYFGEKRLGDSTKRLVIPSVNMDTGEVYVYKTAHHARLERDYKIKAVDVALSTASAPTYFPTHRLAAGTPLIDGGVWANNPVGIAVVEAISVLGWERDSLKVLSLGCTTEPLRVASTGRLTQGMWYWAAKIADVFMTAQSSAALGTAQLLAGHENVIRISPTVGKGRFELDAVKGIPSLKGLGDSEARKALPSLRRIFFNGIPAEPFVPFRQP